MPSIPDRVKSIIAEYLGVLPSQVTDAAHIIDELGADSLDTIELVMAMEEEFGIEIPDDAAEHITTVGSAVQLIARLAV